MKDHNRWTGAFAAGLVAAAGVAAFPTEGTYAVLTAKDYNADSLYADTLSGDAQTAVTQDPDYGKGFFGSSLTSFSKVNRWTPTISPRGAWPIRRRLARWRCRTGRDGRSSPECRGAAGTSMASAGR